ncbi:MAG: CAP domain-containing protein [Thermoleophilia bacterium]
MSPERAVLVEINRVRTRHHRRPLAGSPLLTAPARSHSRHLATTGTLTHEDAKGAPFWQRLVAAGYPRNRRMAENLARLSDCRTSLARQTVRLWMGSPPHRANLLDPRMRRVGIGVARLDGCRETVVTAAFGS